MEWSQFYKTKICPNCGWTSEKVRLKKMVGCSECYETFKDEILEIFHLWNIEPKNFAQKPDSFMNTTIEKLKLEEDLIFLHKKMEEEIEQENFEKADEYLKKIKLIKDMLNKQI